MYRYFFFTGKKYVCGQIACMFGGLRIFPELKGSSSFAQLTKRWRSKGCEIHLSFVKNAGVKRGDINVQIAGKVLCELDC